MKTVIHPDYLFLRSFIATLPDRFESEGKVIYEARNILKKFHVEGTDIVVKRFKKPHIINRFVYGTFRLSKARRSYEYAIRLLQQQIPTPAPVAYMECYALGLRYSYFVSLESPLRQEIRVFCDRPFQEEEIPVLEAFGRFTGRMHEQEVLHMDYSPGNILFGRVNGELAFMLVDINRMQFRKVTAAAGYYNLRRLWFPDDTYRVIACAYARERGLDEQEAEERILHHKRVFMEKRYT